MAIKKFDDEALKSQRMMTQVQHALLTTHRECIYAIREALTAKDIAQGVNNPANVSSHPHVPPVINDNVNDVHEQNDLTNEPIRQRGVSLGSNKGHEVNVNEQETSHAPDATMVNTEGQDEENTEQGIPEPVEASESQLHPTCKRHPFQHFYGVLLFTHNSLQLTHFGPLLQLQKMSLQQSTQVMKYILLNRSNHIQLMRPRGTWRVMLKTPMFRG
jgi:hypothetical protein